MNNLKTKEDSVKPNEKRNSYLPKYTKSLKYIFPLFKKITRTFQPVQPSKGISSPKSV